MNAPRWGEPGWLLALLGLFAGLGAGFVTLAPNRLLSGPGLMLWQLPTTACGAPVLLIWLLLLALSVLSLRRWHLWLGAALTSLLLLGLPLLAGAVARLLLRDAPAMARVQLGAGFWLMGLCAGLLWLDRTRQLNLPGWLRAGWVALLLAGLAALSSTDAFNALALRREYLMQRLAFHSALLQHLQLVFGAVLLALLSGVPLALAARRRARFASALLGTLNLLQTLPSIALFALLIGPLAWLANTLPTLQRLGLGGTGTAPAVLALAAYALLPVVRNTLAGLDGVPAAALDAARGMGMSTRQRLLRVQLPLAWPSLLAGLRMVVVQSIGLAAVAALIGAGGLGRFIFLGLGQGANDLVMLGTVAIIALALVADALFQMLQQGTERRG
jgi:osmoprotectant transport system permease protein